MSAERFIEILGPVALVACAVGAAAITVIAVIRRHIERLDAARCIACDETLRDGQEVYDDASGGVIHAACCGPERESYTGPDGEPLKDGEPIPTPWRWSADHG